MFYCKYLDYSKQEALYTCNSFAQQEQTTTTAPNDSAQKHKITQKFTLLLQELCTLPEKDSFLHYLEACIRFRLLDRKGALTACIASLNSNAANWDCWCLLTKLVPSQQALSQLICNQLHIPSQWSFMLLFFEAKALLSLQTAPQHTAALLQTLQTQFPHFAFISFCKGLLQYQERAFSEAIQTLSTLTEVQNDPFMLEASELLSNIHYLSDHKEALAALAQQACEIDALRPESCVIAGNFYSLRQEPTLAIVQFQRALKLDAQHLGAWVLMGHEYLEMRATSPAIQCYRKALQGDPHDHRAWYALGQCYELLKMPSYALFYYKKAVQFKGLDSRMWSALSTIYQQLGNLPKAISTLKQAISLQSTEDDCGYVQLQRLATLHLKAFDSEAAMRVYEEVVQLPSFWAQPSTQEICAVLWKLALHCYQRERWQEAKKYCMKIYELNGMEREGAQELLSLLEARDS